MKKWILPIVFLGLVLSIEINTATANGLSLDIKNAPLWPVDTRIEKIPEHNYDYYRMQLDQDSFVTFSFDDPSIGSILVALIQDDDTDQGRKFAFVGTTKSDGDERKTLQHMQLRAGLYYVRIDGPDEQPYNATYTVAPLQSSTDVKPNNNIQQANPISLNKPIKSVGTVSGFDDYYTFTLDKTSKVTLRNEKFKPQLASSSVLLYIDVDDDKGQRFLSTVTDYNLPKITSEVLPPGKYFVKVDASDADFNPAYEFILKTETIVQPETYKNSIFGTTLQKGKKIRGFLARNDEYYFTLDHEKKVRFTITTDSTELMSAILEKEKDDGGYEQISDYNYVQQQGLYTLTTRLQAGSYKIEPNTRWMQRNEVNYTIQFDEAMFSDVPKAHPYYKEIMHLSTLGIIQGYTDDLFKPTKPITRRQVFTMLSRYKDFQLTPNREMIEFDDIIRFSADYELILPFYKAGVIDGSYGRMDLNNTLTRAQLAKILVNTFNLKMQGNPTTFKDVPSKHYAYEYIQILASNGITKGSYGYFMPNEPVSREHFSVFLYRLFEGMKKS